MLVTRLIRIAVLTAMPMWATALRADSNPLMAEAADFAIVVERLPDALASTSLRVKDLEETTLAFARQLHLPVKGGSRSWLYLRISGAAVLKEDATIGYAYNVHLHFKQNARSMTSDAMTMVSSWSSKGTSGVAQSSALLEEVHAAVRDEVNEFARAWAAAHGGQ